MDSGFLGVRQLAAALIWNRCYNGGSKLPYSKEVPTHEL
jgi:hypothetical protein